MQRFNHPLLQKDNVNGRLVLLLLLVLKVLFHVGDDEDEKVCINLHAHVVNSCNHIMQSVIF